MKTIVQKEQSFTHHFLALKKIHSHKNHALELVESEELVEFRVAARVQCSKLVLLGVHNILYLASDLQDHLLHATRRVTRPTTHGS